MNFQNSKNFLADLIWVLNPKEISFWTAAMAMNIIQSTPLDEVLELTKSAQERGTDPLMWAIQLSSSLTSSGVTMPSPEVAELLVSHICWGNNIPLAWKFLEKALTLRIVPPMLVLALLSTRSFFCSSSILSLILRHSIEVKICIFQFWFKCVRKCVIWFSTSYVRVNFVINRALLMISLFF